MLARFRWLSYYIFRKFITHCINNNIYLFRLLLHSSHPLQPLDVGVFNPLKTAVLADLDWLINVGIAKLEKVKWIESYIRAWSKVFIAKNIWAGWCHSGLVSINRNQYRDVVSSDLNNAFALSFSSMPMTLLSAFEELF